MPTKKVTPKKGVATPPAQTKGKRAGHNPEVLSPIYSKFIDEYLIDCNGTQAYIRAGGSKNGASVQATRLLADPRIAEPIRKKQKTLADKLGITTEGILREMKSLAFFNIEDYITVDANGEAKIDLSAAQRDQMASISAITTKSYWDKHEEATVTETTLKGFDKKGALEILGRHVGLRGFGKQLELTGKDGGAVRIENIVDLSDAQLEAIATAVIGNEEED